MSHLNDVVELLDLADFDICVMGDAVSGNLSRVRATFADHEFP